MGPRSHWRGHVREGFYFHSRSLATSATLLGLKRASAACWEQKDPEGMKHTCSSSKISRQVGESECKTMHEADGPHVGGLAGRDSGVTSPPKPRWSLMLSRPLVSK